MVKAWSQSMNASSKLSRSSAAATRSTLLALHELDREPVRVAALHLVEQLDRFEKEGLPALPVAQALRAPRRQGSRGAARAPRPPPRPWFAPPAKTRRGRIRPAPDARPVRAGRGQGCPSGNAPRSCGLPLSPCARRSGMITRNPSGRDPRRVAELDPVDVGVGEEPVEQDHRPAPPQSRERRARRRRRPSRNV